MIINWKDEKEPKMEVMRKNGVTWLEFSTLSNVDFVTHAFSTRLGGVSSGIFSSMNLGFTRGDDEKNVRENFQRLSDAIGIAVDSIVTSDQTHTTNIRRVTRDDCGNGVTRPRGFHDIDGLITDEPGVTLATFYADCVPLYFVDPVHKAIGLSHSGWRGTVHKMGKVTVEAMGEAFGTDPQDLVTAIGPSICQDCYEVSEDVINEFSTAFDVSLYEKLYYKKNNGKYQLNLWEANRQILLEAGVGEHHIQTSNLCTCCNSKFLFSHRASQGKRGNLGAFLMIKN
ncbi:peptidoglycan editing factor PgeF [Blautia liquoris]|uniref:Purine nucleoside phosphorylase n=2 Tax=Blautia liquoris TaxID=2779518 RepID=A0A7M2RKS8_9FIRM|nr:peptidoglycan editing factor PgeF [Blautia liquoris]QOV20943.1 peptidoglycan editing factor PgeF [Blautia liquoris]